MSNNTPRAVRSKSTRTSLSRSYIRVALPALLIIGVATLIYGMWQARAQNGRMMAQEMVYVARLVSAEPGQVAEILQSLP